MEGEYPSKRTKYDSDTPSHTPSQSIQCEPEPQPQPQPQPLPHEFSSLGEYGFHIRQALCSFNDNMGTHFKFIESGNMRVFMRGPHTYVHLNFTAIDFPSASDFRSAVGIDGERPHLFFAEIVRAEIVRAVLVKPPTSSLTHDDSSSADDTEYEYEYAVRVTGLALMLKVDTPNPLGMSCSKCSCMSVVHPGPLTGYRVIAGDQFECADFQDYNFYKVYEAEKFESPWGRSKVEHTMKRSAMFRACAMKALEQFNDNQRASFCLVRMDIGFSVGLSSHRIVHLNFWAQWPEKQEEHLLFFAEVLIPTSCFSSQSDLDLSQLSCIKVEGCCIITKRASGPEYFGRVCEVCINGVMHPGFRDGYDILEGDRFEDAQFKEIEMGIF